MKNKGHSPVSIALYGMDERAQKMMGMYLQGPCKGVAVVVDNEEAEVDLIDADYSKAKELLDERQSKTPDRPIILISLQELSIEGTLYLRKPIQMLELVATIKTASKMIGPTRTKPKKIEKLPPTEAEIQAQQVTSVVEKKQDVEDVEVKKNIDTEEIKKVSKHRTAMDLTEGNFSSYIGHVEGLEFSDLVQVKQAKYNPNHFFLGAVQSAFKVARNKDRVIQLNSSWKPLIILPHSHEIWLDADDKQLRAFSGLALKKSAGKSMSLTPVSQNLSRFDDKPEQFYDMDAFIWKLAVWTSKGRYPESIEIDKPVYLKQWPNFTRLVVTPYALQIAALLVKEPRTLLNISESLKISPKYVFVFISAAHTLDLVGHARRQADELIAPQEIKETKAKGLLTRILGRLRR